ncbi:MAG: phosphate regulon sensor protein PhoR, partial [Pseudomonadota bacterium]
MRSAWANVLLGIGLILLLGWGLGLYFGYPMIGFVIALTGVLIFHLRRLLQLERALSRRQRVLVPNGDGVWARVLAGVRYQQQRVRRHKSRYRRLMKEIRQSTNALPDGVIAMNERGEMLRYNAAAQMLIGLKRKRDRGQRVDNLIRHPDFVAYLAAADYAQPLIIPSPRREDGWLNLQIVPYNENNRLLVIRDITERTRLNRMRRDFVANASHELRTPLTVINGYLEALTSDDQAMQEWGQPLQAMSQQADRMRLMLDELLALSRLEAGASAPMETPVDMMAVIRECSSLGSADANRIDSLVTTDAQILGEYGE